MVPNMRTLIFAIQKNIAKTLGKKMNKNSKVKKGKNLPLKNFFLIAQKSFLEQIKWKKIWKKNEKISKVKNVAQYLHVMSHGHETSVFPA